MRRLMSFRSKSGSAMRAGPDATGRKPAAGRFVGFNERKPGSRNDLRAIAPSGMRTARISSRPSGRLFRSAETDPTSERHACRRDARPRAGAWPAKPGSPREDRCHLVSQRRNRRKRRRTAAASLPQGTTCVLGAHRQDRGDRARRMDRTDDDRESALASEREGGGVHDLEVAPDRLVVGQPVVARRASGRSWGRPSRRRRPASP